MSVLEADLLVIGGPAGTWAAVTAASSGATIVLADKRRGRLCRSLGASLSAAPRQREGEP